MLAQRGIVRANMHIPRTGERVYVDELSAIFVVAWVDDETQTVDLIPSTGSAPREEYVPWQKLRAGSANSDRGLSGGSVCRQPKMAETRRADEQTSASEPHSDLQGEGGIGSNQGREDPVGVGRAV